MEKKQKLDFFLNQDDEELKGLIEEPERIELEPLKDVDVDKLISKGYVDDLMSSDYIQSIKNKDMVTYDELSLKGLSVKQKSLIRALIVHKGLITPACKDADCAINSYYRWLKENPSFASVVNLVQEIKIDFIESRFLQLISDMNVQAILFAMKTIGRSRGYSEENKPTTNIDIKFVFGGSKTEIEN